MAIKVNTGQIARGQVVEAAAHVSPLQMGTRFMVDEGYAAGGYSDMSFWEPQRTNNFEFQVVGLNNANDVNGSLTSKILTLSVKSFAAPSVAIDKFEIQYGNNKINYAGIPKTMSSKLILNDYIGANIERLITNWQQLVYNYHYQTIGLARNYKKNAYVIQYNPQGNIYRQWKLLGCFPTEVNMGNFKNDGGASVRELDCTIVYDFALPAGTNNDPNDKKGINSVRSTYASGNEEEIEKYINKK